MTNYRSYERVENPPSPRDGETIDFMEAYRAYQGGPQKWVIQFRDAATWKNPRCEYVTSDQDSETFKALVDTASWTERAYAPSSTIYYFPNRPVGKLTPAQVLALEALYFLTGDVEEKDGLFRPIRDWGMGSIGDRTWRALAVRGLTDHRNGKAITVAGREHMAALREKQAAKEQAEDRERLEQAQGFWGAVLNSTTPDHVHVGVGGLPIIAKYLPKMLAIAPVLGYKDSDGEQVQVFLSSDGNYTKVFIDMAEFKDRRRNWSRRAALVVFAESDGSGGVSFASEITFRPDQYGILIEHLAEAATIAERLATVYQN